ncbi:MAG: hypothetical protein LBF22_04320 [Deltaproteobacteria bacterium]|nr:hypothetical protein [Deltaproteobacteria bacterium]
MSINLRHSNKFTKNLPHVETNILWAKNKTQRFLNIKEGIMAEKFISFSHAITISYRCKIVDKDNNDHITTQYLGKLIFREAEKIIFKKI